MKKIMSIQCRFSNKVETRQDMQALKRMFRSRELYSERSESEVSDHLTGQLAKDLI